MVNQWEYEVFSDHHKQKLLKEAEASRLLKRMRSKSSHSVYLPSSLFSWLRERMATQKPSRPDHYREAENGSKELISG
jgi:hypothetical protein